jgi:DNA-binding Lrp family transcriptional regulator
MTFLHRAGRTLRCGGSDVHGQGGRLLPALALSRRRPQAGARQRRAALKTIFVMVKCELGQAYKVADEAVENIKQISEVHSTSGQYDLLMKCYLAEEQDIGHFVTETVQKLPGVKDTFTLIAFKAFT